MDSKQMLRLDDALAAVRASGRRFYVYVLCRPTGEPFYVGKGSGDRLSKHESEAGKANLDNHRLRVIRQCNKAGGLQYQIAALFDVEAEAFAEERRLINLHGRLDRRAGALINHTDGGEGACNPSAETIRKRVKKLRAVMKDPSHKAAALACLRGAEEKRRAGAAAASRTPEFRAAKREEMLARWQEPEFRARAVAGIARSQDLVWQAKHAEGTARVQSDPAFHDRRNAGIRRPEVIAKRKATMADPVRRAAKSEQARAQRVHVEAIRQRVILLHRALHAVIELPGHCSSAGTWQRLETALTLEAFL